MSMKMRELIRAVRACKTASEERSTITTECARIRTAFKDGKNPFRHRNVAKLLYVHMLGYPSHFGQMESLKLIASDSFAEKRIGYLALMLLLDEKTEVLMLVTNSLKMDLHHVNQYVVGLALSAIGNIASADIARDLAPEVERHLRNTNHYIRKKAALCCTRLFSKVPELVEDFAPRLHILLADGHHSVLLTGVTLITSAAETSPATVATFRALIPALVKVLKKVKNTAHGHARDYEVGNVCDPFLQCKILRLLSILGVGNVPASDRMRDVLASVATHTDTSKNAGNAVMYDCVRTIMTVESEPGLRVLAINRLGSFLVNKDNNIRYVALQTLCQVARSDLKSVRRHRATIVTCLRDPDSSIRRRAFELVYLLVDNESVEALTREMVNYLKVAIPEDRAELCAKIATIVDNFCPSRQWQIDTLVCMLSVAGGYCKPDVQSSLLYLVSKAEGLAGYVTHRLFGMVSEERRQLELVHAAVWCIGEFGETLLEPPPEVEPTRAALSPVVFSTAVRSQAEVVALLSRVMRLHSATNQTKGLCLSALLKLTARFDDPAVIKDIRRLLGKFAGSLNVELQQRSVEFVGLAQAAMDRLRSDLLAPMPILEESVFRKRHGGADGGAEMSDEEGMEAIKVGTLEAESKEAKPAGMVSAPAPADSLLDLDDIFGGGGAAATNGPGSGSGDGRPGRHGRHGHGRYGRYGGHGHCQCARSGTSRRLRHVCGTRGCDTPCPTCRPQVPASGGLRQERPPCDLQL